MDKNFQDNKYNGFKLISYKKGTFQTIVKQSS